MEFILSTWFIAGILAVFIGIIFDIYFVSDGRLALDIKDVGILIFVTLIGYLGLIMILISAFIELERQGFFDKEIVEIDVNKYLKKKD